MCVRLELAGKRKAACSGGNARERPAGRPWQLCAGGPGRTCSDLFLSTAPGTPPNPALLPALCWVMLGILW